MMVSKVAVVALVAIMAVPILMGYALNLSEQTVTEYKPDGDSVNVTELLQTGTAYTTAAADFYNLNSDFEYGIPYKPLFESVTTASSSLNYYQYSETIAVGGYKFISLANLAYDLYIYVGHGYHIDMLEYNNNTQTTYHTTTDVVYAHYSYEDEAIEYRYNGGANTAYYYVNSTNNWLVFRNDNGTVATPIYFSGNFNGVSKSVDLAAGYRFVENFSTVEINLPDKTKSLTMTFDLSSISDSSYNLKIQAGNTRIRLDKATTNGVVTWSISQQSPSDNSVYNTIIDNLYYDPDKSSNTYQITLSQEYVRSYETEPIPILGIPSYTYYVVKMDVDARYVGNWPTIIGNANYYQQYHYDFTRDYQSIYDTFNKVVLNGNKTPVMRLDSALYSAFAYNIIADETYNPSNFKSNPTTTLSVQKAGYSLGFGGNTYTVDNAGNITLGTHKVSTNGLKLESTPVAGGFENKINGNVISVTAQPSTITFNGQWGASVSTVSNAQSSYTHTEWTPGEFAWDGIDQNFLMIGLLTALGVFIALGIAYRKTKAALGALLVVCGGAILLFFTML